MPRFWTPYLAEEMACRALVTVLTCGMTTEAPASRAKPMVAWSCPGTLVEIVRDVDLSE